MTVETRWWMSAEKRAPRKQVVLASSAVREAGLQFRLLGFLSVLQKDDSQKKRRCAAAPKSFDSVFAHPKLHHETVRYYCIQAPR